MMRMQGTLGDSMRYQIYSKSVLSVWFLCLSSSALAAPIAVIDSGVDYKHALLAGKIWVNPGETADDGIDNDKNGYIDDVYGWNFAENNNQVIDYSYLGTFSPDTKKFFDVQLRVIEGAATEEDKKWLSEKRQDETFIQELMAFGNFVHGTHVAGIASRTADRAKLMAVKIIPTKVKTAAEKLSVLVSLGQSPFSLFELSPRGFMDEFLMKGMLSLLAGKQTKLLATVGEYVSKTGMRVANCSFGTSSVQSKAIVEAIGKLLLKRELTPEETEQYSSFFMAQVLTQGASFVKSAPQTFFVMAAGNDGTDNDQTAVFPANLKFENTISVAATRGYDRIASFSNYGASQVEIAAPGVGIVAPIPGNDTLVLSGTSQAAPFVTHIAGKILDANPKLALSEVKQILMGTVDKKGFLEGKVVSGGIANEDRAVRAAILSVRKSVSVSIQQARRVIADIETKTRVMDLDQLEDGQPIALPSLFSVAE